MKVKSTPSLALCLCFILIVCGPAQAKRKDSVGGPASKVNPILSFSANQAEYELGDKALLSWASVDTRFCTATGDWEGKFGTEGSWWSPPLDGPKTFNLKCASWGGGVASTVNVAIRVPEPVPEPTPEPEPVPESTPPPTIAFSAADSVVIAGDTAALSWTTTAADVCEASGGWSGAKGVNGFESTGPIETSTTFSLFCSGTGGGVTSTVSVSIAPEPEPTPPPTIALNAVDSVVVAGGNAALSWTTKDADVCEAGGGWSGIKELNGSELIGPIGTSTTFSLSCRGTGGNALQMVSVSVLGTISISWVQPSENVDGSPLVDLAGYRIYYGTESRNYENSIDVSDPAATSHAFSAVSGDYFVTMTAFDRDGNESTFSNEILRGAL